MQQSNRVAEKLDESLRIAKTIINGCTKAAELFSELARSTLAAAHVVIEQCLKHTNGKPLDADPDILLADARKLATEVGQMLEAVGRSCPGDRIPPFSLN